MLVLAMPIRMAAARVAIAVVATVVAATITAVVVIAFVAHVYQAQHRATAAAEPIRAGLATTLRPIVDARSAQCATMRFARLRLSAPTAYRLRRQGARWSTGVATNCWPTKNLDPAQCPPTPLSGAAGMVPVTAKDTRDRGELLRKPKGMKRA